MVHLLGLHDAMDTDPDPRSDRPTAGSRPSPLREVRFDDVPPGLHDPPTVCDVGPPGCRRINRPSAFEVCSVYSAGVRICADAESTERERERETHINEEGFEDTHQSAGLIRDGLRKPVAPLGSNAGDSGLGVPEAGAENTYPNHAILLLQDDALQKELERPVHLIGFCCRNCTR